MRLLRYADNRTEAWILRHIEKGPQKGFARDLRRLMKGEAPLQYRVLKGFGPNVGELKRGGIRVVYTTEFSDLVGVVCAFRKDAKRDDDMRPEHKKLIDSGLRRLREGARVESDRFPPPEDPKPGALH